MFHPCAAERGCRRTGIRVYRIGTSKPRDFAPVAKSPWSALPTDERRALAAAWRGNVPSAASAIHARWWQFESWLRSLVYVELRSKFGARWTAELPPTAESRKDKDARRRTYMSTPDATAHLAYLDVGELFPLITAHWDLFGGSLIDRDAWDGRVAELNTIRRRIAHCRRPHTDDLTRLEQVLRDIDPGAFRAMASFNDRDHPEQDLDDELVRLWVRGEHAQFHIVEHAYRQYDTRFALSYSKRPWAQPRADGESVSGRPGYVWHATWHGAHVPDLRDWWRDSYFDINQWRDLILFVCADEYTISISFAAADDPAAIAEGIGHCFQPTLQHRHLVGDLDQLHAESVRWRARALDLDLRVQVGTGWNYLDPSVADLAVFGA